MGDGGNAKCFVAFSKGLTSKVEVEELKQNAATSPAEKAMELYCKITRMLSLVSGTVLELKTGPSTTALDSLKSKQVFIYV